ncbi:histidinol-phosphate transaminase [Aerococcaceae bacterium 50-4]
MKTENYLKTVEVSQTEDNLIMNRNTSPKRPLSDQDIVEAVLATPFNQYPENEEVQFINAYANYTGLNPKNVAVANGSDEWIQKLVIQFGQGGVLALDPDFFMYQDYTHQLGYPFFQVASEVDFSFDIDTIIKALDQYQPSLFFISNPQNPTGQQFPARFLQMLADETEKRAITFVIDEAYIEFGQDYQRPDNANVLYIRTLSKIYGVAGLRVGLAIGQGPRFEKLKEINHPYPMNSVSLNLARKLFEDTSQLDEWVAYQRTIQQALQSAFDQVGDLVTVIPSATNFVFIFGDLVPDLDQYLADNGFIGRKYAGGKMAKAARYSIIDTADYPKLKATIKAWRDQVENN